MSETVPLVVRCSTGAGAVSSAATDTSTTLTVQVSTLMTTDYPNDYPTNYPDYPIDYPNDYLTEYTTNYQNCEISVSSMTLLRKKNPWIRPQELHVGPQSGLFRLFSQQKHTLEREQINVLLMTFL